MACLGGLMAPLTDLETCSRERDKGKENGTDNIMYACMCQKHCWAAGLSLTAGPSSTHCTPTRAQRCTRPLLYLTRTQLLLRETRLGGQTPTYCPTRLLGANPGPTSQPWLLGSTSWSWPSLSWPGLCKQQNYCLHACTLTPCNSSTPHPTTTCISHRTATGRKWRKPKERCISVQTLQHKKSAFGPTVALHTKIVLTCNSF